MRVVVCLCWLLLVGTGFFILSNYENARGAAGDAPRNWPQETSIVRDQRRETLVMFAHPQCPCTRASLEELNRLLARCSGRIAAQVWFFKPDGFPTDWTRGGLWRSAAAIPGVRVREDSNGAQARLFGAETSGYVLLYNSAGRLLFKGGITAGRGHAGDNAGENAIVSLLDGEEDSLTQTPVYGCALLGECRVPSEKTAQ
jgi:hypothetical protein